MIWKLAKGSEKKLTWREKHISVGNTTPFDLFCDDTFPNYVVIQNNSANIIYFSISQNVGVNYHDMQIPANSRKIYCRESGINHYYLLAAAASSNVYIATFEEKFNPAAYE